MNRFGINLWNWVPVFADEHLNLIDRAAEIGFGAVEIGMNQINFNYAAVRERIEANNLELTLCAALTKGRDISNFDERIRNNTKKYLRECLYAAEQMKARLLVGPLFAGGGKAHHLSADDRQREWELAVCGLREIADVAADCGVVLGLEPINRYRTSVVNTVEQAQQMLYDIGKPNIKILFDTYQANIEEADLCVALETILKANQLVHFHACENHRGAPGMGHIPWHKLIPLLKKYKYEGHVTMETFVEGALDGAWYNFGVTQDELAEIGLRNLRKLFN